MQEDTDFLAVRTSGEMVVVAARKAVLVSLNGGHRWYTSKIPPSVTLITDVSFGPHDSIWLASREGAFRSSDGGDKWEYLWALPVNNLFSVTYDRENNRMLVTSLVSTEMFETVDGRNWHRAQSGWLIRNLVPNRGGVLATTAFDGIVQQSQTSTSDTRARLGSTSTSGQQ